MTINNGSMGLHIDDDDNNKHFGAHGIYNVYFRWQLNVSYMYVCYFILRQQQYTNNELGN